MPAPTITPLPTPPSRSTDPTNFAIEADAFVAALPEFVTDANAQASYLDGVASAVDADAAAAAASAADALESETNAAASAAGAAAAADVSAWVSGTTYAVGVCVFSPIDFQTYRRTTNGAGTTDPSSDAANWVAISGAGANIIKAIASGAITNGAKIVLNANETVSSVAKSITQLTTPTADTAVGSIGTTTTQAMAVACSEKLNLIMIAYNNNTTTNLVVVGQLIGDALVFFNSEPGNIPYSATLTNMSIAFDDLTEQAIVCFTDNSTYYGYFNVGKLTEAQNYGGWTLKFGSNTAFQSSSTSAVTVKMIPGTSRFVISYVASNLANMKVGTLKFKDATIGTAATIGNAPNAVTSCFVGSEKFAICYRQVLAPTGLYAAIATISGSTITYGTPLQLSSVSTATEIDCACDVKNQKLITTLVNSSNNNAYAYLSTISGTTLTAGNSVTIVANIGSQKLAVCFDPYAQNFLFSYRNAADTNKLYATSGTVTGSTLSVSTALSTGVVGQASNVVNAFFPFAKKPYAAFIIGSNKAYVQGINTATVTTNLTAGNFLGVSDANYENGAEAKIQIIGSVDDAQSDLTPGNAYYVGMDGSLKLAAELWEPTVFAGTSVSATKLLIKG